MFIKAQKESCETKNRQGDFPNRLLKAKNKLLQTKFSQEIFQRGMTVFCCVCIIVFGITLLSKADPITTSIGQDISTNNLSLSGSVTSGTWAGSSIDVAHGGTGQDWSAGTQGSLPFFSGTGALSTLTPGTAGQFLQSGGVGANPSWASQNVQETASYIIYTDGVNAYAKNGATGQIDYSGSDPSSVIQSAINATQGNLANPSGGKVLIGRGVYSLSHKLSMGRNVFLEGEYGQDATKLQPANGYTDEVLIDWIYRGTLKNINLDGRVGDGFHIGGIKIHPADGLGDLRFTISDNWFTNFYKNPIYSVSVDEQYIIKNRFLGSLGYAQSGGQLGDIALVACSYTLVEGNSLVGTSTNPSIQMTPLSNSVIVNNNIEAYTIGITGVVGNQGASMKGNVQISNNLINGCTNSGIYIYNSDNFTISNNVIFGHNAQNTQYGIKLYADNYAIISGNQISSSTSSTKINYGIWLDGSNTNNTITENTIRAVTTGGIYIAGTGDNNNNILNNIINTGAGYGIKINSATNSTNVVMGNSISGFASGTISNSGTNTVIYKNVGYLTENSSTATITAGQTSVTVTHNLAATPTRVQLTPTTLTGGKDYYISAKTATTFTITIDSINASDITFDWRGVVGEGN